TETTTHMEALFRNVSGLFIQAIKLAPYLPDELQATVVNVTDPAKLSYLVAANLNIDIPEKQRALEENSVRKRLEMLSSLLSRELEILELGNKIQ
ncbi:MAG: LON peptidase substrate-binding domain-containing protein, partial [Planctomycetota bacterium]|nr:LON peptidase substrate-binding domain-containing protein [Planctomycetota bacterium]